MNRLNDLQKGKKQTFEIDIADEETSETHAKRGDDVDGTEKGSLQEFYKIVAIVKNNIVNIVEATKKVIDINQNLELSTTEDQETNASDGLTAIIQAGNKNAKTAQALLKDLNKEVLETEKNKSVLASELRIRKNLIQTLTKKYIDVLKEYQDVQNKSKEVKKKRAVKRIKQVKPDATPEEIEAVLQSGGATNFARQAILQGDANEVIKNAFENVNNKYQDVLKLEASVAELAQMFQDFALIVEKQGELLDQIEYQVK
jgi:t-SNARE complex subunit (syntaxin)